MGSSPSKVVIKSMKGMEPQVRPIDLIFKEIRRTYWDAERLHKKNMEADLGTLVRNLRQLLQEGQKVASSGGHAGVEKFLTKNKSKIQGYKDELAKITERIFEAEAEAEAALLKKDLAKIDQHVQEEDIGALIGDLAVPLLAPYERVKLTETQLIVKDRTGAAKTYNVGEVVKLSIKRPHDKSGKVETFKFMGKAGANTLKTDTGTMDTGALSLKLAYGQFNAARGYSNLYDAYDGYGYYEDEYDAGSHQSAVFSQDTGYHYQGNLVQNGRGDSGGFTFGVMTIDIVLIVFFMAVLCFVFGAVFGFVGKVIMDKIKVNEAQNVAGKRRDIGI